MRKISIFLTILCLAVFGVARANEVTIGDLDGAPSNSYLPMNSVYKYSYTQQIYTADEIGMAGTINSITIWMFGNAYLYEMPFDIYMVETDKDAFSDNTDWETVTSSDIVYSGTVTVHNTEAEAFTFDLDAPFSYSGNGNLLIAFNNTTGQWKTGLNGKVFGANSDPARAIYARQDNGAYNPYDPTFLAYGTTYQRNVIEINITLSGGVTCGKPETVEVFNIGTNGAQVTWTGGSGTYNMEYKKTSDELWTSVLTNSTATSVELTNLTPGTNYQAKVQSVCVFDDTTMYADKSVSFRTLYGIPLIEEFPTSNNLPTGWNRYSGLLNDVMGGTELSPISIGWNFGSSNGMFDSHARVNIYGTNCNYWLVTPSLLMGNNVELSFEVAYTAYSGTAAAPAQTGTDDKFVVLINNNGTWEILRQWDNAGSEYVLNDLNPTPLHVNIDLSSYAGQNIAIAFYAESTEGNADNNLHIDNVSIDYIPICPKPTGLTVSEVTGHTALLHWVPAVAGQAQWQICLNSDEENLQLVTSTDSTYMLTGLTGATPYIVKVRAYCSADDQSQWSNQQSFTTLVTCTVPTSLTNSNVTNHSATLNWTSDASEWILAYRPYSGTDDDYIEVPVTEKPYVLDGLSLETRYIVRVRANCGEEDGLSTWSNTTDFTTLNAYPAPVNVACDSVLAYSAYLSWTERGTAMDWEVAYKLATDDEYTLSELTPDNNQFLLGELDPLMPGTDYVFKVRSIYFTEQGVMASEWSNEVPFTTLLTCPAPTEVIVYDSTINAHGATLNWHSVYSDSWNVKYREPAYVDGIIEEFGTSIPSGWEMYTGLLNNGTATMTYTTYGWTFGNGNGVFDNHARVNIYSNYQRWLVMPEITVPSGIELSFDMALTAYNGSDVPAPATTGIDDKFIVLISTDDMATWTTLREWNNSGSEYVYNEIANTAAGEHVSIDLSAYAGQNVRIAFYGESTQNNADNNLHIDNVSAGVHVAATEWQTVLAEEVPFELNVLEPETHYEVVIEGNCPGEVSDESESVFFTTKPNCLAPTDLVVIESTITAHAATLSWTENGTATEWVIEYTTTIDGEAVTDYIYNVTENPYTFEGLVAETPYAVRVLASCGPNNLSQGSNMVSFTTLVACPVPNGLAIGSTTATGATVTWNGNSDNYIVMFGEADPENMAECTLLNINFETGDFSQAGFTTTTDYPWTVVANDHNGAYCAKSYSGANGQTSTLELEVTFLTETTLTFSAKVSSEVGYDKAYFSIDDNVNINGISGSGSWIDYSYTLDAGRHTLRWYYTKDDNVFSNDDCFYVDDIKITGLMPVPSSWAEYPADEATYTFEELEPGTTYFVKVKSDCGQEGESVESNMISFITLATCPAPTGFEVTGVTGHTATMVWNGESDSYVVNYRIPGHIEFIDADFENGELPAGWTSEGPGTWSVGTGDYTTSTGAHGGNYNAKINHDATGDETYLVTLNMDLSERSDLTLGLWYINRSWSGDTDGFGVYYRIDGGVWNEIFATTEPHDSWTQLSEALPEGAYAANCQIGFKFTDHFGYGVGLDDITLGDMVDAGEWIPVAANNTTVVVEGLAPTTTYEARLQGVCGGEESTWTEIITFTTDLACPAPTALAVDNESITGHSAYISWTGSATAWQICLNDDMDNLIELTDATAYMLTGLRQDFDYAVKVRTNCGNEDGTSAWSNTVEFHTLVTCAVPANLAENNIGTKSVSLTWEGESESYVVRYIPWYQVDEDQTTTAELTTYTYDLSGFSGSGSIAIRHYNVSDLFLLIVDDIVVKNAQDEIVFSENFEGSISSQLSLMDLDGDGYNWQLLGSTFNINGTYGIGSYSYDLSEGALTPDNWLIISDVELGGQLTLVACGQDTQYAAENFGVFVLPDDNLFEETVEGGTSIDLWDLTPNTSYAWQVAGVCEADTSNWVASFFTTLDDVLVFVTDGEWDNADNWEPAEVPTTDKKVRIEANAIIPAGAVATAKRVELNGGSILIKDGGQLKQGAATLRVTMEKEITGYGESDGNYYFISSPFGGRTLYQASGTWSRVDNLFDGEYDLYAFDPNADLEWINYKANPTHISFLSDNGNEGLLYGEGYLYANQDGTTLEFVGTTGKSIDYSETKDYTYVSGYDFSGYALVGNYFSCNAYINYVDDNGDALQADFYTLNNDNTFTLSASNVALAPCTGALMNVSATGKVQYSTEAPTGSKGSALTMNVTNGRGNVDMARVRFGNGFNLRKMSLNENSSKLYMTEGNQDYAVVYADNQGEMPVNFKAESNGTYTISFNTENVEFGYLHLIDNLTGNDVDLLATPSYSFEARTYDYASRFKLVFSANDTDSDSFAFISNGEIILNGQGTVQVYDITGRMISSHNNVTRISTEGMAAGVYMIRLINGNGVKTQKIVVK